MPAHLDCGDPTSASPPRRWRVGYAMMASKVKICEGKAESAAAKAVLASFWFHRGVCAHAKRPSHPCTCHFQPCHF